MDFIFLLLIEAAVFMVTARLMPQVEIKDYGRALLVAFLIGIPNATIGCLPQLPLNILPLGLLSFFVRLLFDFWNCQDHAREDFVRIFYM
jgi:putative membrane protein